MRKHLNPSLVVSFMALFVALSGASYAAIQIPKNSVGTAQLKANSVVGSKVKAGSLMASDFKAGQIPAGAAGTTGATGAQGALGAQGATGATGQVPVSDPGYEFSSLEVAVTPPPADPTVVLGRSFNLPAAGYWYISMGALFSGACPAGGERCSVAWGLYVDGEPAGSVALNAYPAGVPVTCFPAFGSAVLDLAAGSHTVSVGVKQTSGPTATITACADSLTYSVTGPSSAPVLPIRLP